MSSSTGNPWRFLLLLCLLSGALSGIAAQANVVLANNAPFTTHLSPSSTAYFSFIPSNGTGAGYTLVLSIAAAYGFPTLFASNVTVQPSAATALYSASTFDGGAILIAPAGAVTWYLTVSSDATSATNFTLVVSSYDPTVPLSTAIPLANAVSQASAVSGGSYRYYTFALNSPSASQLSIAVTQSSSDVLVLVNLPGNTALPTLSAADISSLTAILQLVTFPVQSQGLVTIGVWSAVSSSFTISAFTVGTLTIQPLPYGVAFPGFVGRGTSQYFSFNLDPSQLQVGVNLRLSLYSLSGDADLYCSQTTAYPSETNRRWISASSEPLDQIDIFVSELVAGTVYCAVSGFSDSSFTFLASFNTPILLTPADVVFVQSAAGDSTAVFITVEYSSDTTSFVVVSVASQYGMTALYANGYPRAAVPSQQGSQWVSTVPQPLQALPLVIADVCNAGAIPDSDPKLCGINLLVFSPVNSYFRLAVEVSNGGAFLLPGQPFPGALQAGGLFVVQFSIPNNFVNVSLLVTLGGNADSASISVGRNSYNRNSSLWTVTKTSDDPVLLWSIDWTDPNLSPPGNERGEYYAFITASINTSVTVLYTVSNGTGYNGAPTQLIAGEPQYGVLPRGGQVNFYTFQPPPTGWPYDIVISCTFTSGGVGQLTTSTGDGTIEGPTPGVGLWYGRTVWTQTILSVASTALYSCNPNIALPSGLPCLYQMVVQAPFDLSGSFEYFIVATTTATLRLISTGQTISSVIAAGSAECWLLSYDLPGRLMQMLAAAQFTQGRAVLYGSNITAPSASTAQQMVVAQPTGLLTYQSTALDSVYYFICVSCTVDEDCLYSLQYSGYSLDPPSAPISDLLGIGASTSVLLGPARTAYYSVILGRLRTIAYVLVQVESVIGSVTLYSSLGSSYPNATTSQWTANSTTMAITILNLTVTASQRLRLTVQADSASVALSTLSVSVAGVSAILYSGQPYQIAGLLLPAFPVSTFSYQPYLVDNETIVALGFQSSTCPAGTQLYVSDTVQSPGPGQPGVTFNYTGTLTTGLGNRTERSVLLSNIPVSLGSPRIGTYSMSVVGDGQTSCSFQVGVYQQQLLSLVPDASNPLFLTSASGIYNTYWASTMQPDTPIVFALQFSFRTISSTSTVTLYAAVGKLPTSSDPTTYSLVINASTATASQQLIGSFYVPGSLCPPNAASLLSGCQVMMTAVTDNVDVLVRAMTTATPLTAGQSVVAFASSTTSAYYQMPLPTGVTGTLHLAIFTSAPVQVYCSYRFIRPSSVFYDWTATITPLNSSTADTVDIAWSAPLLNAINGVAPSAGLCYCSVSVTGVPAGFTLSYSFTATSEPSTPSSSSALSAAQLFLVIFFPVLVAAATVLVLVGLYRRRLCCCDRKSKDFALSGNSSASSSQGVLHNNANDHLASMNELQSVGYSRSRVSQGSLLQTSENHSDGQ